MSKDSSRVPSVEALASIADATKEFLAAYEARRADIEDQWIESAIAASQMVEFLRRLWCAVQSGRLSDEPHVAARGWPELVTLRVVAINGLVRRIIDRWDVTEIYQDLPIGTRGVGKFNGQDINRLFRSHALSANEYNKLRAAADTFAQALTEINGSQIPQAQAKMANDGGKLASDPPVVCSQAALARHLGYDDHTTGLAEKLTADGTLSRFMPPSRRGGKYQFWFAKPNDHAKALEQLSGKPHKRPPKKNKA